MMQLLRTWCLCFAIFMLAGQSAYSQSYWESIEFYTTRNGLPGNSVSAISQDSKGFLWVSTHNGLCRYDGKEFKLFNPGTDEKTPWSTYATAITEDASKNLWVGTRTGKIAKLEAKSKKWRFYNTNAAQITEIYTAADGIVWVGTFKGILYKIQNDSCTPVASIPKKITKITRYDTGHLLAVSEIPYLVNIQTGHTVPLYLEGTPKINEVEGSIGNSTHIFYFLTSQKVTSVNFKTGEKYLIDFEFNYRENTPGILRNGNLLLINKDWIAEYTPRGSLVNLINLELSSGSLKGNAITTIFEDNSGLIWLGTNAGLFKVDNRKINFKKYTSNNRIQKIKYNYIRALHSTGNTLWIGTKEGELGRLITDSLTGYVTDEEWYAARLPTGQTDISFTINTITTGPNGTVWAGGTLGLYCIKNQALEQLSPTYNKSPLHMADVWTLKHDTLGNILAGTAIQGMFLINVKTLEAVHCEYKGKPVNFPVWNIFISSKNRVWVGTEKGVFLAKYSAAQKTYHLEKDFIPNHKWATASTWGIAEDPDGNLWFATTGQGIARLNEKTGEVKNYTVANGLVDNITSAIVADRNGNIWVSTVNGLSKFDQKKNHFVTFKEDDGLLSNDFNFKAATYTPWGEVVLGTKVGIVAFYPEKVNYNLPLQAPVEITGVKVKAKDAGYTMGDSEIYLQYNQNDISFRFAVLEYRKEFSHTYRYMLKGFENNWQTAAYDNPTAVYTNLRPGTYTFVVMGSADGRVWSEKTAQITITITPALWQRPVFWFIAGGALLLLTAFGVRRRIRQIIYREREKANLQRRMAELEMKALRAQMNPHFIFNAIGAIQHYMLKNDTLTANEYLSRFARLMRLFLESSRNNYSLLRDEIQLLQLYVELEKQRFEEKFDFVIEVDPALPTDEIKIPSMLLQPFAENAINHGLIHKPTKGRLKVSFSYTQNREALLCEIDDDGIGRQNARQLRQQSHPAHISRGAEIVEERVKNFLEAENIHIDIDIIDKFEGNNPAGTTVKMVIPLQGLLSVKHEGTNS